VAENGQTQPRHDGVYRVSSWLISGVTDWDSSEIPRPASATTAAARRFACFGRSCTKAPEYLRIAKNRRLALTCAHIGVYGHSRSGSVRFGWKSLAIPLLSLGIPLRVRAQRFPVRHPWLILIRHESYLREIRCCGPGPPWKSPARCETRAKCERGFVREERSEAASWPPCLK